MAEPLSRARGVSGTHGAGVSVRGSACVRGRSHCATDCEGPREPAASQSVRLPSRYFHAPPTLLLPVGHAPPSPHLPTLAASRNTLTGHIPQCSPCCPSSPAPPVVTTASPETYTGEPTLPQTTHPHSHTCNPTPVTSHLRPHICTSQFHHTCPVASPHLRLIHDHTPAITNFPLPSPC